VPDRRSGFLDPCRFPFVALLQSRRAAILADLAELPLDRFGPWVQPGAFVGDWRLFAIWHGRSDYVLRTQLDSNGSHCRRTRPVLRRIRGVLAAGFSRLAPGAHVLPHVDQEVVPSVRCHFTLVGDAGARMRVRDEVRPFEPGAVLVFRSGDEHESVHEGARPRVTLIVEVETAQAELEPLPEGSDASGADASGEPAGTTPG
jgi:beta-hydroxylase